MASEGVLRLQRWVRDECESTDDAAEKIGTSRQALHSWTTGARTPDENSRGMIAEATTIPPEAWDRRMGPTERWGQFDEFGSVDAYDAGIMLGDCRAALRYMTRRGGLDLLVEVVEEEAEILRSIRGDEPDPLPSGDEMLAALGEADGRSRSMGQLYNYRRGASEVPVWLLVALSEHLDVHADEFEAMARAFHARWAERHPPKEHPKGFRGAAKGAA